VAGAKLIASGEMGGTFPETAALIILLNKKNSYQKIIPSWNSSKILSGEIGILFFMSLSSLSVSLTCLVNDSIYEVKTVCL
jgi:hypothetical protein